MCNACVSCQEESVWKAISVVICGTLGRPVLWCDHKLWKEVLKHLPGFVLHVCAWTHEYAMTKAGCSLRRDSRWCYDRYVAHVNGSLDCFLSLSLLFSSRFSTRFKVLQGAWGSAPAEYCNRWHKRHCDKTCPNKLRSLRDILLQWSVPAENATETPVSTAQASQEVLYCSHLVFTFWLTLLKCSDFLC